LKWKTESRRGHATAENSSYIVAIAGRYWCNCKVYLYTALLSKVTIRHSLMKQKRRHRNCPRLVLC